MLTLEGQRSGLTAGSGYWASFSKTASQWRVWGHAERTCRREISSLSLLCGLCATGAANEQCKVQPSSQSAAHNITAHRVRAQSQDSNKVPDCHEHPVYTLPSSGLWVGFFVIPVRARTQLTFRCVCLEAICCEFNSEYTKAREVLITF